MKLFLLLLSALNLDAQAFEVPSDPWASVAKVFYEQLLDASRTTANEEASLPFGEATVSFSVQGSAAVKAATGRRIPGIALYSVVICTQGRLTVPLGEVYQLATTQQISPLDPDIAIALFNQTVAWNWTHVIPTLITDGSAGLALLGAGGVVHLSSQVMASLIAGFGVSNIFAKSLEVNGPNPSPVLTNLLRPAAVWTFPDAGCQAGTLIGQIENRRKKTVQGTWTVRGQAHP